MKSSPRQTFAHIAGAALADGLTSPIYGYNNRSESSIVAMQVFSGFILRAKLMKLIENARVLSLFSDSESFRNDKLLMYGTHIVISGYSCPLPLCFAWGGISVTGETLRDCLIHGVTADNILSGGSQMIPELAADLNNEDVAASLLKLKHLHDLTPIGIRYETFIKKLSNSLTDGDSKYRFRLLNLLRADQKEVMGGNENYVSIQGTWCLNHCLSLAGNDLRTFSDIVDKAIKHIIAARTFIHGSSIQKNTLRVKCKELGIKCVTIPDEFEDRFQAWLGEAIEKYVALLPALFMLFADMHKPEEENKELPRLGIELTKDFWIVAFILRWIQILRLEKKLDKELQEWDLLCDEAADKVINFIEKLKNESQRNLGVFQRQFYGT